MTKEEYQDFVLRYKGCGACFPMYHTLSRFEKLWFTAIQKDVAELEKENANLKIDNDIIKTAIGDFDELQDKYEEEQRENNGLSDQLTKAKEIMKKLLHSLKNEGCEYTFALENNHPAIQQAEQFLKE